MFGKIVIVNNELMKIKGHLNPKHLKKKKKKRVDHYYENHNVEKNVESQKTTFDVVIILNAIGKIRTSKV